MVQLNQELLERRWWLKSLDNDCRQSLNYPKFPAYEILRISAGAEPDKAAIDFYGSEITLWELQKYVVRLANGLIEAGIKKGDRVGILLPNCPQFVITFYALLHCGAIVVNLNPMYTPDELEALAKKTGMTGIVTFENAVANVKQLVQRIDIPFILVTRISDFINGSKISTPDELGLEKGWFHFSEFLARCNNPSPPWIPISHDDPAVIQFTGGTTGTPKGATLTHHNLVVGTLQATEWGNPIGGLVPVDRKRIFCVLPYFHVYGEICCMAAGICSRSTQVILPRFDLEEVLDTIERVKEMWYFPTVATMFGAILNHPRAQEMDIGRKIGLVNCGAAPTPLELIKKARSMDIRIAQGYGMSETTSLGITTPYASVVKPGSIGIPYMDTDLRIIDSDGNDVPLGTPGEIIFKSPLVMKGYWDNPEATASTIKDGWIYTGDVAYMDEDGYIFIVDRTKDMIIAGGYNIYPQEIDDVLFKHPKVKDVITIGIPDEYRGETVKSFVQRVENATVTEAELIAFVREHLAAYKAPRFIEFRSELPRSAVGKALRRVLRDEEIAKRASQK